MEKTKYSAYINDKLICFTDVYSSQSEPDIPGVRLFSDASHSLDEVIRKLSKREDWTGVIYISASPKRAWDEFVSRYTLQEAAGGLVKNEMGEYLIIYRKGRWDLPKGKIDYDENPADAALREVKEECGVENLELGSLILTSFHTYTEKNKDILKKTHWYMMKSSGEDKLIPQLEEGIEKVEWMSELRIKSEVYSNTFGSIKNLLSYYFDRQDLFESNKA